MNDEKIPRFEKPTLADLMPLLDKRLGVDESTLETVRAVLAGEIKPYEVSEKCAAWISRCYHEVPEHEQALAACDDLLGGHGVEALNIEGAVTTPARACGSVPRSAS